jgi:hypothetical protein
LAHPAEQGVAAAFASALGAGDGRRRLSVGAGHLQGGNAALTQLRFDTPLPLWLVIDGTAQDIQGVQAATLLVRASAEA